MLGIFALYEFLAGWEWEPGCDPHEGVDVGEGQVVDAVQEITRAGVEDPPCPDLDYPAEGGYSNGLMRSEEFVQHGRFDPVHNCRVEGNVTADLLLVDGQTTGSCSLMAQEQFVQRYTGQSISESELIDMAWKDGVYSWWGGGTTFAGWDSILDRFDVPHRRFNAAEIPQLEQFLGKGCDALVSVDASILYDDPSIGPDAGHAIAVVGRGMHSWTGKTTGFYITDSNFPGTTRFVPVEQFAACWRGDMIAVPATPSTNPSILYA